MRLTSLLALTLTLAMALPLQADVESDVEAAATAAEAGDFETSLTLLNRIIDSGELPPERHAVMLQNRGVIFQILDDPQTALDDFNRAIALSPTYTDALYNRGITFMALGRPADAANDFSAVIREEPAAVDAYGNLAEAQLAILRMQHCI